MSEHQPPDLRASDADRERVANLLREAGADGRLDVHELDERLTAAYASRTHAELTPLTRDLGTTSPPPGAAADAGATASPLTVRLGASGERWIVAVMSGSERRGHWRAAATVNVIALMGGVEIDLREVELTAQETHIRVWTIMGGCDVTVPDGLEVHVHSVAFMGGNGEDLRGGPPPRPGGPVVHIHLVSIMGGSDVTRLAPGQRKSDRKRLNRGKKPRRS